MARTPQYSCFVPKEQRKRSDKASLNVEAGKDASLNLSLDEERLPEVFGRKKSELSFARREELSKKKCRKQGDGAFNVAQAARGR